MKIKINRIDSYTVATKSGDIVFKKVSTWNGLTEFANKERGLKIIASRVGCDFGDTFNEIFHGIEAPIYEIVMCSPQLVGELTQAE